VQKLHDNYSESKGCFFYKTNRFESIRVTNRIDSNRELECCTGRYPLFHAPIHPCRRPIVQRRPTRADGDSPASCPGADRPLHFPVTLTLKPPPPAVLRRFGRAAASYVDRSMASWHRPGTASGSLSLGRNPTLITPVKGTYSGEIESLDRDPVIATLDLGM